MSQIKELEMPQLIEMDDASQFRMIDHYILDDGRIWSIKQAKFVKKLPEDAVSGSTPDKDGNASLQGLIECLAFYGYEKGELKSDEELAAEARKERDKLLAETDFMVMPDYPLDEEKLVAVKVYRQVLRDIPQQDSFPKTINWPVKP